MKRNLVRRIIRESFRLNQNNLPAQDMIIMVRKGADEVSNENLHKLAKKCWSRLNKKVKQANSVK